MKRGNGEGSIYYRIRNGKKYYSAQITIGFDDNGKQIRKTISGYNRAEVLKKKQELEFNTSNLVITSSDLKFGEYYHDWLFNIKRITVTKRTFEKYEADYRLRLSQSNLMSLYVSDLTTGHIQNYVRELLVGKTSNKLIGESVNYIKQSLDYAVKRGIIYSNPALNVELPKVDKKPQKINAFTKDEQATIIANLTMDPVDMLLYIGFSSGLRRGELFALTWDDCINGAIAVNKQVVYITTIHKDGSRTRNREVTSPKTVGSNRIVPLPDKAIAKLKDYKVILDNHFAEIEVDNKLVFPDFKGGFMSQNRPARRLKSVCKKTGVKELPLHSTRHSYATRLFEQNVQPKTVQKLLGHEDISTTLEVYTHVMEEEKLKAVESLNNIF